MSTKPESVFGKGYAYCLGLFIAHEWKMLDDAQRSKRYEELPLNPYRASSWFNAAADHLFELQVPTQLPEEKQKQIDTFKKRCLSFRLCMDGQECKWEDAAAALNEAKDLLREWDEFNGIPSIKGSWQ